MQPTAISGLIEGTRAIGVSCGHRHSMVVFNHHPLRVMDDVQFQPYLKILEVRHIQSCLVYSVQEFLQKDPQNETLKHLLRRDMKKKGLDPELIEDPAAPKPDQVGMSKVALKVSRHDRGLR